MSRRGGDEDVPGSRAILFTSMSVNVNCYVPVLKIGAEFGRNYE
jgi:hypothetical protein